MCRKFVFVLILCVLLSCLRCTKFNQVEVRASDGYPVHNLNTGLNYTTIQEAISDPETLAGNTIFVEKGMYYEGIVVNKSLSLIGESQIDTVIDGNGTDVVILVEADNVTIRGFSVRNGSIGICVDHSKASLIEDNYVTKNTDGILVRFSSNCTVCGNSVANNTGRGALITNSWNFTVRGNYVYGHGDYGINANASSNGVITGNNVYENSYDGIGLLDSNNCRIVENLVRNNIIGVWIDSSDYNSIYHNNIVDNWFQGRSNTALNAWNNTVEGNYWSDYTGEDANKDGIGDSWYEVDVGNTDYHPLMGMFHSFNTSLGYRVNVISNSTIENFQYSESNSTIVMHVSNTTANQAFGFCRVRIPHTLMNDTYHVIINGSDPTYWNYTLYDDGNNRWIYFSYQHSTLEIVITPEFPSLLTLPLFMITALLAVIIYKRRHSGTGR
jgi:nitrous oxidase accessory protein